MQHGKRISVSTFRWDNGLEGNLAHCARHEVTPVVVTDVSKRSPLFFLNDPGKTGTHVMIGPDTNDRFWTIIIAPASDAGAWKPITGWPSTNTEIRRYNGES